MATFQKNRDALTLPESSIVLLGLSCSIVGLAFRDSFGITSLLAAVGIGLVIAGSVYIAVDGPELVRLSLAFLSLVALQLLSFGSVVRWIGAIVIGTVIVGASYSRVSN